MTQKNNRDRAKHDRASIAAKALYAVLAILVLGSAALVIYTIRSDSNTPAAAVGSISTTLDITEMSTEAETQPQTEPPTEAPTEAPSLSQARNLLQQMTLEEKLCQLMFVTPESLTGVGFVNIAGPRTKSALEAYPVGGIIYFSGNIENARQVTEMAAASQAYAKYPLFIGVDEEGGRVSRLSSVGITEALSPMAEYGASGDTQAVEAIGKNLGLQMSAAGFNLDFAPVADIVTNPANTEIGDRAFSADPQVAAQMVAAMTKGLQDSGILACLKHFPGHGSTAADSHLGRSVTNRTLEELRNAELLPFTAGIEAGASLVMISHMSAPQITGNHLPCDLSPAIVTDLLRNELGYKGVVITDSHSMGAITEYYSSGEAAVLALQAGCDIILMPHSLPEAVAALQEAVSNGTLTEARINESVLRILALKYRAGIIKE